TFFVQVGERDVVLTRAVQDDVTDIVRQGLERRGGVELVERRQAGQHLVVERVALIPATYRAGRQAEFRKAHHALRIEKSNVADAIARRAGAYRIIEAEQA